MSAGLGVSGAGMDLLVEAGAVLATSLDLPTTMSQVASLTVPRMADLCVIDLQASDGSIKEVAVAAADRALARDLEDLRDRFPVDPDSEHPVARVIRSGTPLLLADMSRSLLRSFAQGSEHAQFMIGHHYRSAVVAPLPARGRTLGALSVLRLGESAPYAEGDLALISELARRSALAIDNARLFSDLHDVEERLQAVLGNLAEAITMEDEAGQTVYANQAAAELLRVEGPEAITGAEPGAMIERFLITDEQGRELGLDDMPGRRLFAGERPQPLLVRSIVRATGEERWLVLRSSPVIDPSSKRITYVVNVFENITGVKRAELAESFMAEASRVLVSSTDYTSTLARVARLAAPQLADWCAIDVLSDGGELERVAVHHVNPDKLLLLERLDREYRLTLDGEVGIAEVLRNGQARIYSSITPEALESYADDREHVKLLRALGTNTVIVAPMVGGTKAAIGTITLGSGETPRRLTRADLGLAVRLARRAGTAVERARIYNERARIAHILQRALLPEHLPEIPGVEVRALYAAAGELNEVGGDFYDVFDYEADRWMLVVGDVVGKGPRAAGVTALARHSLRAAAISGQSPTEMLGTLHQALHRQPQGADLCTACLVVMTRSAGGTDLTVALAGHEPPLLIDPRGEVRALGQPGTLLGVIDPISITETHAELGVGHTLLLFTDGVTDAGRPERPLEASGLRKLCAAAPGLSLGELLESIERAAVERAEGYLHDDIALLALRLTDQDPPNTR
jgi:PAS domain S-box-containing protein